MAGEIGLVLDLILKLLPIIKPSELEQITKKIKDLEEDRAKDKQDSLEALAKEPMDVPTLKRLMAKFLDM